MTHLGNTIDKAGPNSPAYAEPWQEVSMEGEGRLAT
ncbi:Uncharacterised protein [Legionella bozemanae]|nr:Uncharacterised protein [Legionella bozemanae]